MFFGTLLTGVDHLPQTYVPAEQRYARGQPAWGAHLADELERHRDAARRVHHRRGDRRAGGGLDRRAGAAGGLPRAAARDHAKHGILLIFDEVITAFGRLGKGTAAEYFGVEPDIMTLAKGINSGTVPMGAVMVRKGIYDAFMQGPERSIELFHGYTYSAHPLACAAALATLDVYRDEELFERAADLAPYWEDAIHSLKGERHVIDLRNIGLIGAVELEPRPGAPAQRAYDAMLKAGEKGLMIRVTGDIIAMSPPLTITRGQIDTIIEILRDTLRELD